ncbi:MAG TPA: fibronectin type III domain-containing protein, partial [bacterium]|nr:fibronectin type III domain-containing protein [bacterium]
ALQGTITFNGSSDQTVTPASSNNFRNLVINKTGNLLLDPASENLKVLGNFTLESGILYYGDAVYTFGGDFRKEGGSFSNLSRGTTVFFTGDSPQAIDSISGWIYLPSLKIDGNVKVYETIEIKYGFELLSGQFDFSDRTLRLSGTGSGQYWDDRNGILLSDGSSFRVTEGRWEVFQSETSSFDEVMVGINDSSTVTVHGIFNSAAITVSGSSSFQVSGATVTAGNIIVRDGEMISSEASVFVLGGEGIQIEEQGILRISGGQDSPSSFVSENPGTVFYRFVSSGTLEIDGLMLTDLGPEGVVISTSCVVSRFDEVRFEAPDSGNAPAAGYALDFRKSDVADYEFGSLYFADHLAFSIRAPDKTQGKIRLGNWSGLKGGSAYEEDSNGVIAWEMQDIPVQFSGTVLSSSSVLWHWTDADYEDGYIIYSSTGGLVSSLGYGVTYYVEQGFVPNAPVERYVEAWNDYGVSSSAADSVYTLANPPGPGGFSGVSPTKITVIWSSNDNLSGTDYLIAVSSGGSNWTDSEWLRDGESHEFTELLPETDYFFRGKARNKAGLETEYSDLGSAGTLSLPVSPPSAPSEFSVTERASGSLKWRWQDNSAGSSQEEGFRIRTSTGGIIKTLSPDTTSWKEAGLSPNDLYARYSE